MKNIIHEQQPTNVEYPEHDYNGFIATVNRVALARATAYQEAHGFLDLYTFKDPEINKELFRVFLENIADPATRQHYNCNTCRQWFALFGNAFLIRVHYNDDGTPVTMAESLFWNFNADELDRLSDFAEAQALALQEKIKANIQAGCAIEPLYVEHGHIRGHIWGRPTAGGFDHMHFVSNVLLDYKITVDKPEASTNRYAGQVTYVHNVLNQYSAAAMDKLVAMLKLGVLKEGMKYLKLLDWYRQMRVNLNCKSLAFYAEVNNAPEWFFHITGGVVGATLNKIMANADDYTTERLWNTMLDPLYYQRPQSTTEGNIEVANKLIEEKGLARSMMRRFAFVGELEQFATWIHPVRTVEAEEVKSEGGFFDSLKATLPKAKTEIAKKSSKTVTGSWKNFVDNVLPEALELYFVTGSPIYSRYGFMQFTTALHADAPPILRYDHADNRNPFSLYAYEKGSTFEDFGLFDRTAPNPNATVDIPVVMMTRLPALLNVTDEAVIAASEERGVVFLLAGADDLRDNAQHGLFPHTMLHDLHPIRATLEHYSRSTPLARPTPEDIAAKRVIAAGIGLTAAGEIKKYGILFRVVTKDLEIIYHVDYFE